MMGEALKVFISWSGPRSKAVATHVKQWVSQVFQGSVVFMSDEDIKAGTNWSERIKKELADTTVGIVCMTPENQDAKWINYEMGALSKEVTDGGSRVIPLLIGFSSTTEVGQPAASLNMVMLGQDGFKKIATSLNDINAIQRSQVDLDLVSDMWWEKLGPLMEEEAKNVPEAEPAPASEGDMVKEILESVRALRRSDDLVNRRGPRYYRPTGQERNLAGEIMGMDEHHRVQLERLTAMADRRRLRALDLLRSEGFPDAAIWVNNGVWKVKTTGIVPDRLRHRFNRLIGDEMSEAYELIFEDVSGQEELLFPEDE
jgi:hypothetical protein